MQLKPRHVPQLIAAFLVLVLGLGSCGGTTEPPVATSLAPLWLAPDNPIAGEPVLPPPSVKVMDQNGKAMAGVTVEFALTAGGGTITGASAVTNEFGIATVGSWTLGEPLGTNTLTATIAQASPVSFTVIGVPGPPSVLIPSGDNQSANYGTPVAVPPSVTVKDAHNHVLAGVQVFFEIGFGFGSLTGATATTDASGRAQVGSWTLGQVGLNTMLANVPGRVSFFFTAEGLAPCGEVSSTFGATRNGSLSSGDCQLDNGAYVDLYTQSVTTPGGSFSVHLASSFNPHLYVYFALDRVPVAEKLKTGAQPLDAGVRIIGPPSQMGYTFFASSVAGGETGTYSLSTAAVPANVTNCEEVFITRDADTFQNLESTDCSGASYYDEFKLYLADQHIMTVDMTPTGFAPNLELFDPSGTKVATGTGLGHIAYLPQMSGYFVIRAGSALPNQTGPYRLSVR